MTDHRWCADWEGDIEDNDVHVLPIGDLREHIQGRACWCRPRIDLYPNETAMVVHHSLDGREHSEPGVDSGGETVQ